MNKGTGRIQDFWGVGVGGGSRAVIHAEGVFDPPKQGLSSL